MRFPFKIDHRRIALAPEGPGKVYVWDTEWRPPTPPDIKSPVFCGVCWMADIQKRHWVVNPHAVIVTEGIA